MEKYEKYDRVTVDLEPCLSGLRFLFAKEVGDLNPLASSNLAGSATNR